MAEIYTAGKGVAYEVDGDHLVIWVDLTGNCGKSSTGKTTTVATTSGFKSIIEKDGYKMSVHVLRKP